MKKILTFVFLAFSMCTAYNNAAIGDPLPTTTSTTTQTPADTTTTPADTTTTPVERDIDNITDEDLSTEDNTTLDDENQYSDIDGTATNDVTEAADVDNNNGVLTSTEPNEQEDVAIGLTPEVKADAYCVGDCNNLLPVCESFPKGQKAGPISVTKYKDIGACISRAVAISLAKTDKDGLSADFMLNAQKTGTSNYQTKYELQTPLGNSNAGPTQPGSWNWKKYYGEVIPLAAQRIQNWNKCPSTQGLIENEKNNGDTCPID